MGLEEFKNQKIEELSLIEVAHAILEERHERMAFVDLVNAIQNFLNTKDEEIRDRLPQFYTDLNIDGSFISLGDNVWGLRSWYSYESVDEEVNHPEDEEETPRKKNKKVNAFLADVDDDIIDYDADDPEDDDLTVDDDDEEDDDDFEKVAKDDVDDDEDEDELPDGIEGQLADLGEDDDDPDLGIDSDTDDEDEE
ncbi:DNA-directed RNA polymerase, delta subunit [Amylolactobacillus amylotrophicus DSM 20534]|uniref:DNA-directed RNA polymerase subunit delta n=4 Tax=Amylolactobacillus TaxID=2767876 RepID=A0A1L6XB89_9LACO|nr:MULTISPECIES: DNA-directed RNA polymerase subunit delta [Amylolactobacillus]APT18244.1 DNA-directed RNA polymerase subunit delta [Amylolactobacillus amylophilus DSM 20533 = JCM 1125]KRK38019.1 DNA-directed RNA polymerase, delta subunit [Amylolactobacillus amylotrophicus DSM 20534]KRM42279.1 DNA-directed RNA polymerase, delta subunit [Amylolactobacillus amylophilus DSM 20533 = JCM 1125]GED80167.1 putative DNA-directed RNA polymerase subunit delta [Amylolactobacillus amylophilus]